MYDIQNRYSGGSKGRTKWTERISVFCPLLPNLKVIIFRLMVVRITYSLCFNPCRDVARTDQLREGTDRHHEDKGVRFVGYVDPTEKKRRVNLLFPSNDKTDLQHQRNPSTQLFTHPITITGMESRIPTPNNGVTKVLQIIGSLVTQINHYRHFPLGSDCR